MEHSSKYNSENDKKQPKNPAEERKRYCSSQNKDGVLPKNKSAHNVIENYVCGKKRKPKK
jgi:hypothetical protein